MTSAILIFVFLVSTSLLQNSAGFLQHFLWKENASLVASIRVASVTVFSPARCLAECVDKDCTLLTLAVTRSTSGERLDCHFTKVTDWLNKSQVYLEPCKQSTHISCSTFVGTRTPHLYFPLDGANQLDNLGSLLLPDRKPTLRYKLASQSGNPFSCTGPSGNPHVKYLLNDLDTNNTLIIDLNNQWQPTEGFTLAMWVMFPGSPATGPLFEFFTDPYKDNHFWFWNNVAQLYFNDIHVPSTQYYSPLMSMTSGQWYHVAMTGKSGGELVFYWNATQIYRATNASATMTQLKPSHLFVGARTPNRRLEACLAHAIVHTETLDQLQSQHLMLTQLAMP